VGESKHDDLLKGERHPFADAKTNTTENCTSVQDLRCIDKAHRGGVGSGPPTTPVIGILPVLWIPKTAQKEGSDSGGSPF
jgi:hypothetical protein